MPNWTIALVSFARPLLHECWSAVQWQVGSRAAREMYDHGRIQLHSTTDSLPMLLLPLPSMAISSCWKVLLLQLSAHQT